MAELTAGKVRGLAAAATEAGIFTILAVDHRDSMRALIDPLDPGGIPAADLSRVKLTLVAGLADLASAVLLDPEYSALQAVTSRVLRGDTGFLCAVEAQGYLGDANARVTPLLDGWSVAKAKKLGAAGIKLLLLYRPDSAVADEQDEVVAAVVAECADADIALFLEPVAYELDGVHTPGTSQYGGRRREIVVESARRLGALGPDVLKLQFPVDTSVHGDRSLWAEACAELDAASPVPWALLSGGDPFESFVEQVRIACQAGASGFLVGRALWAPLVTAPAAEQPTILRDVVRPRLEELVAVATESGKDWARRHQLPDVDHTSFASYGGGP